MSCNLCGCLELKDGAVTIGIWSTVYSLIQIAVFGWQFAVLSQCQHVVMAQSNLQCDYYCPCVGATTARTSAIIEAANTLLPNYNTYGRYDIPTYYESYWQSPEERYYTGLFVIQVLCLIVSFFLLFSSIMLIYGIHTWSRCLVWPWIVVMSASILTSLAYCIMWWAGDVRDYWLLLTIIEFFGILLNIYCFVVICIFHRQMFIELKYYEDKRNYGRLDHRRKSVKDGLERNLDETKPQIELQPPHQHRPFDQHTSETLRRTHPIRPAAAEEFSNPFDPLRQPRQPSPPLQPQPPIIPMRRPKSAMAGDLFYDTSRKSRRSSSRRHRSSCKICDRDYNRYSSKHHHHHQHADHEHRRERECRHHRKPSYSDAEGYFTCPDDMVLTKSRPYHLFNESIRYPSLPNQNYTNIPKAKPDVPMKSAGMQTELDETFPIHREGGITIPQHIIIPPPFDRMDRFGEKRYQINSEIKISYDPDKPAISNEGNLSITSNV